MMLRPLHYLIVMPLIDYVRYEDASEEVSEALADSAYSEGEERHLFYELLSNAPHLIPTRAAYFRELMAGGVVPARQKELAYCTVGLVTDTPFVASTHARYLVDDHDVPPETIRSVADGDLAALDERDRAVVTFARTLVCDPASVSEATLRPLWEVGYDDAALMELTLLVCAAETATTISLAMDIALADRGDEPPAYLPASDRQA
jgi:alkylhydroperoxidase family enzyme